MHQRKPIILGLLLALLAFAAWYVFFRFPNQAEELQAIPEETDIRVILLGTGSPVPSNRRFGPATLVQAGGQTLLFDVGRGAMQRLHQLNIPPEEVNKVFVTHLHSDHILAMDDVMLTTWTFGRDNLFEVWGPDGTEHFVSTVHDAYRFDIDIRIEDSGFNEPEFAVHEIAEDGVIYEKDGVRVTAFEVDHAPIEPAYGFRVDYAGRSALISGDTRFSENLIKHAEGVDVLIHEVAYANPGTLPPKFEAAFAHHTSPTEAGEVFTRAEPELAVYSHIVLYPGTTLRDLEKETRKTYDGPLMSAEDLTVFDIGDEVNVRKLKNPIGKSQLFYNRAKAFLGD